MYMLYIRDVYIYPLTSNKHLVPAVHQGYIYISSN